MLPLCLLHGKVRNVRITAVTADLSNKCYVTSLKTHSAGLSTHSYSLATYQIIQNLGKYCELIAFVILKCYIVMLKRKRSGIFRHIAIFICSPMAHDTPSFLNNLICHPHCKRCTRGHQVNTLGDILFPFLTFTARHSA